MIAFGPVPSRRLGRSLGINNIPPKVCSYSCVYCQLGRTRNMQVERRTFYKPEKIFKDVQEKVVKAREIREPIDYLTFVPDGEPTLDVNLGHEIELLKPLGIKVAVITNASITWREKVKEDLMNADCVSLKLDSIKEKIWRKINRPYQALKLTMIMDGILDFAKAYRGELMTETMLVKDINDGEDNIEEIADFLVQMKPAKVFISIPTRPPAEIWAKPSSEKVINRAYQIFSDRLEGVEYLIGYEGNAFAFTGKIDEDILSITAVHPMREEAVRKLLLKANGEWSVIDKLIDKGKLVKTEYKGNKFFIRKLSGDNKSSV